MIKFRMMRQYNATIEDIKAIAKCAINFEINKNGLLIRQKLKNLNESVRILGFDNDGIRNLNK